MDTRDPINQRSKFHAVQVRKVIAGSCGGVLGHTHAAASHVRIVLKSPGFTS